LLDLFRAHQPEVEPASDRVEAEQFSERNSNNGREVGADLSMQCGRQKNAKLSVVEVSDPNGPKPVSEPKPVRRSAVTGKTHPAR